MNTNDNRLKAHKLIDHIFQDLLPAHGMAQRPEQIQLSHRMLDAMQDGRIALCDAGTGIGKTYAYLAAATAASAFPTGQIARPTDVYFNELTAELVGLIKAATGHALVLFTSYAAMSAVKERLWEESLPFPLLTLGRNAPHIIEQFRHTPGAVLLATGAAWEGFDFPGDCVSLLIIPRLPFAYPDARKERELEKYPSLHAFIREVAVPEMQIKLRQGFGRAIRTESDTCVIAILDERACRGRRYAQAVSEALPEMRRTGSLREVTRFLREKKPESYFEVGR